VGVTVDVWVGAAGLVEVVYLWKGQRWLGWMWRCGLGWKLNVGVDEGGVMYSTLIHLAASFHVAPTGTVGGHGCRHNLPGLICLSRK